MKNKVLGIFFYLLYLLAMVRPVLPVMEYYANYNYIATVLCENKDKPYLECNGKCYLEKQLNKANHNGHDHSSTIPQIDLEKYPVSPIDYFSYQIKEFKENVSHNYVDTNYILKGFDAFLFKPPQQIS